MWKLSSLVACLALALGAPAAQSARATPPPADAGVPDGLSVRITSPLGRTGAPGRMRIVAQVMAGETAPAVRFLVDGVLLRVVEAPPYAVEWDDENPFEPHEIRVEAEDRDGNRAADRVALPAFEVTDTASVTSVMVDAAVYDAKGRFVTRLARDDWRLEEDGVPQTLDLLRHDVVPVTFTLLLDASRSMAESAAQLADATDRFAGHLRPTDQVMVAPFTTRLGAVTGPTRDRATIVGAIAEVRAGGRTSIFDALREAGDRLQSMSGRRALILLTDGYDETSAATAAEAQAALTTAQVTTYVLCIGGVSGVSSAGRLALDGLTAATGGRVFFPRSAEDVGAAYEVIVADVGNRYLLSYTPTNQKTDGRWRRIVVTAGPGRLVRAKTGYTAPRPAPIRPSFEFIARHARGTPLDVTPDDLVVVENGVEQKIDTFHEAVAPVSIVLALDQSGSMKRSRDVVVEAARRFVETLRPEDRLAVLLFSDQSVVAHTFTTAREQSLQAVGEYVAEGGTALYDAIADSLQLLEHVEGRRALVLLTDGVDENRASTGPGSMHALPDAMALLARIETTVFPIGLGRRIDSALLERLAAASGGQAHFPASPTSLEAPYRQIVDNLRRRYVVGYTSTNVDHDGAWRTVDIRLRRGAGVVLCRQGYFAPDR